MMAEVFPHIDFRREVTIGHLMLDIDLEGGGAGQGEPADPPARGRRVPVGGAARRRARLGVSDHACCRHEMKIPKRYFGNIWMAKSGFGGTEYLLPALVSEGTRRGMGYNHMARVTSWNPAQRFGLNRKGDIAEGFDADIALVDPARTWTIRAKDRPRRRATRRSKGWSCRRASTPRSCAAARSTKTASVIGKPRGQYLHRPTHETERRARPTMRQRRTNASAARPTCRWPSSAPARAA